MTIEESATVRVADALVSCGILYMLVGSFSSNYYGVPRSTKDADFVLQVQNGVGAEFAKKLGEDFILDAQIEFETVTGTFRQLIRKKGSPFKIELFFLSKDEHDQSRFARRVPLKLHSRTLWLPTAEDVIVTKLRWARGKDRDDVKDIMSVQRGKLDWKYIEHWCEKHGSLKLMEEIRRSIPEI